MLQYIPRHTGGAEPGDSVVRVRVRNAKSSKDIVSFIQECKKGVGRGEREREREKTRVGQSTRGRRDIETRLSAYL